MLLCAAGGCLSDLQPMAVGVLMALRGLIMLLWSHTLAALWADVLCACVQDGFVLHQAFVNTLVCAFTPRARCVCVCVGACRDITQAERPRLKWNSLL